MSTLRALRLVGFLEGMSFVFLLFVAMPMKYAMHMPLAVRVAGSTHGVLFLLFLLAMLRAGIDRDWPARRYIIVFVSSLVPFGTFALDGSLKREASAASD